MFRRKTEPVVEWVTSTPALVETYPIVPARQVLPEWFRKSAARVSKDAGHQGHGPQQGMKPTWPVGGPKTFWRDELPTVRHCPGIVDVLRSGYLLRAWTDIEITTPEPARQNETDRFMDRTAMNPQEPGGKVGAFGPVLNQMLPLWPNEYGFALKFDSPWVCKTPPGWSLLYSAVPFSEKTPFRVLPGLVDTDSFHVVNIVIMWDFHGSYLIEAGTPLCWLLPVKREGYNFKTEVTFNPERASLLRTLGKGGIGGSGGRLLHGSYILERARRRKESGEA